MEFTMVNKKVETPNEILARLIIKNLQKDGLVGPKNLEEIRQKLAAGTASGRDWKVWIENPIFAKGDDDEKPN
jgi:hypothetical protein